MEYSPNYLIPICPMTVKTIEINAHLLTLQVNPQGQSVNAWSLLTPVCFLLEKYKNFVLFWQEYFKSMPSIQYVKRKWMKNKELEVSWPMFLSYEVMLKYFLCIQVLICSIAFCELLCCTILTNIFVGLNHGTHLTVKQYWFLVHNMSVTLFEEGIISAS